MRVRGDEDFRYEGNNLAIPNGNVGGEQQDSLDIGSCRNLFS